MRIGFWFCKGLPLMVSRKVDGVCKCKFLMCNVLVAQSEISFFLAETWVEEVLNHRGCSCSNVACPMQEYHDNIGDLDGPEEKERAQGRTKEIIASLSLWCVLYFASSPVHHPVTKTNGVVAPLILTRRTIIWWLVCSVGCVAGYSFCKLVI